MTTRVVGATWMASMARLWQRPRRMERITVPTRGNTGGANPIIATVCGEGVVRVWNWWGGGFDT